MEDTNAPALAMAYVPAQEWDDVYEDDLALSRGTLFPALDKPFIGKECSVRGSGK